MSGKRLLGDQLISSKVCYALDIMRKTSYVKAWRSSVMSDLGTPSAFDLRGLVWRIVLTVLLLLVLAGPGAEMLRPW